MASLSPAFFCCALIALTPAARAGASVALPSIKDNSIYSELPDNSNGAFPHVFAGRIDGEPFFRRALVLFDVAGNVPAGATITSASLAMRVTLVPLNAFSTTVSLHKLLASWGEAASDSGGEGGAGIFAEIGDVTWNDRYYDPLTPDHWTTTGGDFVATATTTAALSTLAVGVTFTGGTLVADVQSWLDQPADNHGWMLVGDESLQRSARRYASREHPNPAYHPTLTVQYTPPPPSFCDAGDGSLAACPCANAGAPDSGCDIPQGTGGVALSVLSQTTSPNGATLQGAGYSPMGAPTAIVIRSSLPNLATPVVFGDGIRCIDDASGLVRLAASNAMGGVSTHTFGNGALAGSGTKNYQLWFRSTPSTFCDAMAAFNLSNGRSLTW